jgi:hypothetical protein
MVDFLASVTVDPMTTIHGLLACNYGAAAVAAKEEGHVRLMRCYLASAVLYAAMGAVHLLHLA